MRLARLAASEFDDRANISVGEADLVRGSTLHGHDFYELEIIKSGECDVRLNGHDGIARAGTIFFMTPADFHEYRAGSNLSLYKIQFATDAISSSVLERLVRINRRTYTPTEQKFIEISRLAALAHELYAEGSDGEVLSKMVECIILLLLGNEVGTASKQNTESRDIQKAITYIHAHFKENPPLSEVAATLPLNANYFCRCFRAYTKKTYKEYLKELKLRYARRLILATSLSILEIAERSGYGTQSHFNREFKEYYGVSPLKLRFGGNQ